jgi:dephospho-CoA kinase
MRIVYRKIVFLLFWCTLKTMQVIGITGTVASGKGAVVDYLKQKGFAHFSARDFIIEQVHQRGLEPTRANVFLVGNSLRKMHGPSYILESLFAQAKAIGKNAVLESVRATGELEFLRKQDNFHLLAVDADPKVRYGRAIHRRSALDHVSFEKFIEDEQNEMRSVNPTELNIDECMRRADFKIMNEGSKEELNKKVEEILNKIMPN